VDPEPTLTAAGRGSPTALILTATGRLPKVLRAIKCERRCRCCPWFSRPTLTCSNRPICGRPASMRRSGIVRRRQQPRDKGVLSGAVDVRSDLLRRLRASSPPDTGHRGVRAGAGAPPALDDGLHLPRLPRRGGLPPRGPLGPLRQPYTGNGEMPTIGACPPSISR
jgi:hypothetical protein